MATVERTVMATIRQTTKSAGCRFDTCDFEWQHDQDCTRADDPRMATKVRIHQKGCFGLRTFKRGGRTPRPRSDRSVSQGSADRTAQVNEVPHHGYSDREKWGLRPLD